MIDYSKTLARLRSLGYISGQDLAVIGSTVPSAGQMGLFGALGGAIGGAIAMSKMEYYVIVIDNAKFRFYEIDKRTGEYLNRYSEILKKEIIKCKVGKSRFVFVTKDMKETISYPKKINGFLQETRVQQLNEFMKNNYRLPLKNN